MLRERETPGRPPRIWAETQIIADYADGATGSLAQPGSWKVNSRKMRAWIASNATLSSSTRACGAAGRLSAGEKRHEVLTP